MNRNAERLYTRGTQRLACILLTLLLVMGLAVPAAGSTAETANVKNDQKTLRDYVKSGPDVEDLLAAAEKALAEGLDGQRLLKEMFEIAEEEQITDPLNYAVENIAAQDRTITGTMESYLTNSDKACTLDVGLAVRSDAITEGGVNIYETVEVSDALRTLLADSGAQYCLQPLIWPESAFTTLLGTDFAKFRASRPRPGYACVVIKKGTEYEPLKEWNGEYSRDFCNMVEETVNELLWDLKNDYEDTLVMTGNPNLASVFLVMEMRYPFYANYGDPGDFVKGYNCTVSLTAQDSAGKKMGTVSGRNSLGRVIYEWHNWIAQADIPQLTQLNGWSALVKKTGAAMQQQRSNAQINRKITSISAQNVVNSIVIAQAEKTKDAWQKAIYQAGAKEVQLNGDNVTFMLRGFQTDLGEPWNYAAGTNPLSWLQSRMKSAGRYALEVSLPVQDGQIPQKGMSALRSAVTKAAAAAKKVFAGNEMTAALKDYFFGEEIMPAALQAIQKQQKLNGNGGPHAMVFSCVSANPSDLLNAVVKQVADSQAFTVRENRVEGDNLKKLFDRTMTEQAAALLKSAKTKYTVTVDLDDLLTGKNPEDLEEYLASYSESEAFDGLEETVNQLPDRAAIEMPKNGLVFGTNRGTPVTFRISEERGATYILMRSAETDEPIISCFVRGGTKTTVRVPKGKYTIAWCSGPYWYGEQDLFGPNGRYNKSETVEILSTNYQHTFTLEASSDGDVSIYGASPEDFR